MSGFNEIKGEHTIQSDLAATNPNFSKGPEYRLNCGNCVAAYEMRRRGFDVEAAPRVNMPVGEWKTMFDGFASKRAYFLGADDGERIAAMIQDIESWGEGARGTIYGGWKGTNDAHFFSVEVSNSKAVFVDPQDPRRDASSFLGRMAMLSIRYGRLDNLEPSANVKQSCMNRRT